jgi:beta-lactam-binding protein with PASTA domain
MTIYYVSSHETYVRDYKVEADSVDEAVKAVKDGLVDHFDETHYQSEIDKGEVITEEELHKGVLEMKLLFKKERLQEGN